MKGTRARAARAALRQFGVYIKGKKIDNDYKIQALEEVTDDLKFLRF